MWDMPIGKVRGMGADDSVRDSLNSKSDFTLYRHKYLFFLLLGAWMYQSSLGSGMFNWVLAELFFLAATYFALKAAVVKVYDDGVWLLNHGHLKGSFSVTRAGNALTFTDKKIGAEYVQDCSYCRSIKILKLMELYSGL